MKYKVLKTSETGQKLQAFKDRWKAAAQAQRELIDQLGSELGFEFKKYIVAKNTVGKLLGIVPIKGETMDAKTWKRFHDGYAPNLRSRVGKGIQKRFDALPKVFSHEVGTIIGFHEEWCTVGFADGGDYFLIQLGDTWRYEPTEDLEQILDSEFYLLKEAAIAAKSTPQ